MTESPQQLVDVEARRRIHNDLSSTFVVEAAAGTGKTTALVGRILSVIRAGDASLEQIVALTFTEKAAGEMKLRLRSEIETARASAEGEERIHLSAALEALEGARISTMHGFCSDILRERPVEAGVDPLFEVAEEQQATALKNRAFDSWFEQVLSDPPEGVRRVLTRGSARDRGLQKRSAREKLQYAASEVIEYRDFDTPWGRPEYERQEEIDKMVFRVTELGSFAAKGKSFDVLCQFFEACRKLSAVWTTREAALTFATESSTRTVRDYDAIENDLFWLLHDRANSKLWKQKGRDKFYSEGVERKEATRWRTVLKADIERLLDHSDAEVAALLHQDLRPVIDAYREIKVQAGVLDFNDLISYTRRLLIESEDARNELRERSRFIFVDEFQDTDPLQAEVVLLLAGSNTPEQDRFEWKDVEVPPGRLFLVGDPKQAIYRFRRADIGTYRKVKDLLVDKGAEVLFLQTSFRATPAIQAAVNVSFAAAMDAERPGQVGYVALAGDGLRPKQAHPSVIALPIPEPYGATKVTYSAIDGSTPMAVAKWVAWLINESGWQHPKEDRPYEQRDVCLLFKSMRGFGADLTRPYRRALEDCGMTYVSGGGQALSQREEVLALHQVLRAIEWPADEFAVYAALKSPFFSLRDEALLLLRERLGRLHPLRRLDDMLADFGELEKEAATALSLLGKLHARRNSRSVAETIGDFLSETRAHAGIAYWPNGEHALANLLSVQQRARRFEAKGSTSFRAFVEYETDEESNHRESASSAPLVEDSADGVRLLTVHAAKGLEFPVVVLCHPSDALSRKNPSRYVDGEKKVWAMPLANCRPLELTQHKDLLLAEDEAEAIRLVYVAATRAQYALVIPACGDAPIDRWLAVLSPAIYPEDRRSEAVPAPNCPSFGKDTVVSRPVEIELDPMRPGMHRIGSSHRVVWWDPYLLMSRQTQSRGLRQHELLAKDDVGGADDRSRDVYATWQASRSALLKQGAAQTVRAKTVTKLSKERHSDGEHVLVLQTDGPRVGRPGGPRFGTLVHEVLSEIPFDAQADHTAQMCEVHGRLLGATEEEKHAAAIAVDMALQHPLMKRAEQSARCHRECGMLLRQEDGSFAEGIIDLVFEEDGSWMVIDFKTDLRGEVGVNYLVQVELYARAISESTGETAKPILLSV